MKKRGPVWDSLKYTSCEGDVLGNSGSLRAAKALWAESETFEEFWAAVAQEDPTMVALLTAGGSHATDCAVEVSDVAIEAFQEISDRYGSATLHDDVVRLVEWTDEFDPAVVRKFAVLDVKSYGVKLLGQYHDFARHISECGGCGWAFPSLAKQIGVDQMMTCSEIMLRHFTAELGRKAMGGATATD